MVDNKTRIIIICLVIIILIVAIGGTALYFTTDMLKSSETLFKKYGLQNLQDIVEVTDISEEEKTMDYLRTQNFSESTDASLKYLKSENDEEEVYKIREKGNSNASKNESYRHIMAAYGENNNIILNIEQLKQNDMIGIRLSNVVKQYVSVENKSLSYLISSMGYDSKNFSETLKSADISGVFSISNEEAEKIIGTYANIIFSEISKNHYSSNGNAVITLNNKQSVTTKAYTLTLTKNEFDKICKKVLNQAVSDETILAKLDKIDEKIKEIGFVEPEGESLRERYIAMIQKKVENMDYQGENNSKIITTIYVVDGRTVRTEIKNEQSQLQIDLDQTSGKKISVKTIKVNGDTKTTKTYASQVAFTEQETLRTISYSDDTKNLSIEINKNEIDDQNMTVATKLNYNSNNISNIDFEGTTEFKIVEEGEISDNFTSDNNITLNNFDGEGIKSLLNTLKEKSIQKLESIQSIIKTKMLNNIILKIDEREQQLDQEQKDNEKLKKDNFNNKFILYEGEKVEQEYIEKLIAVAGENMKDYKVISGTQIKIFIQEGNNNEKAAEEILTAIATGKNTFDVKLNYGENGYVESIDIAVHQKN